MEAVKIPNAWSFCLVLLLFPLYSSQEPEANLSACRRSYNWVKWISEGHFDASKDCGDLSFILQAANKHKKKIDFCSAEREHVFGYIRESIDSGIKAGEMPEDCAIEQWWYEGHYPKSREAFCKTATRTYNTKDHKNRTALNLKQPYHYLIHGPRSQCSRKLREELATIGNPDVAGPGVMASYLIQLLLLAFFSFPTLYRGHVHTRQHGDRSFLFFYGTSMILAFSIAIASAVTFAEKRAATSSLRSDLHFPEVYEYRLLTLAPAFALLPVLAAHTLHEMRQQNIVFRLRHVVLPRIMAVLVCLLCVVVIWVIWVVGEQGHQSPVQFVFGGGFDIHINDFLYQRAGNYTLAIAILTTILPILGSVSMVFSHRLRLHWPALGFRVVCILLAVAEVTMLFCIRTMAIKDGKGRTSETEVGFGQILACFTWFPVLFTLLSGMEFPGVDEATARAPQGMMLSP
ncbi:hypothetical protein PG993_007219 [Apiospora rasikravindrae]|uniref:Uncharacterized protein n=1 Tax=Apiospora rasikravindrae TaxID=990691 RepID=A0ABR1SZ39_9PEZI